MATNDAKGRKIGRNKKLCEIYRALGMRERNKRIKIDSHLHRHPADAQARKVRAAL